MCIMCLEIFVAYLMYEDNLVSVIQGICDSIVVEIQQLVFQTV